jgi:ABC-type phosphate transport system substrate-binding protein
MRTKRAKLSGRLGAILTACIVCLAALGAVASTASATEVECAAITASGSSLQNIAQKNVFIPEWEKAPGEGWKTEHEKLKCKASAKIEYTATSSGIGLAEWGSKTGKIELKESPGENKLDAFIGTDVGPEAKAASEGGTPEPKSQMGLMDEAGKSGSTNNKVVTVPIAQSAIAVIVSLPVGCTPMAVSTTSPEVTNKELQETWFKKGLNFLELLSNLELLGTPCDTEPDLQARSKPSGTTAGFKRYMNDLNEGNWKALVETAEKAENTEWPSGTKQLNATGPEENDTGGHLALKVYDTPGTMGYADLADARNVGFTGTATEHTNAKGEKYYSFFVLINNGPEGPGTLGVFEGPEANHGGSNCVKAEYPLPLTVGPDVDWSGAKQNNTAAGVAGVYPICTLTFDVAWQWYSLVTDPGTLLKYTEAQEETVFNYLSWVVLENGGQALAGLATNHYAVLPKEVQKRAEKGITTTNIHF